MPSVKSLAKAAGSFLDRNSPTILTALAAGGVVSTAVLAVRATPMALSKIEVARIDWDAQGNDTPMPRTAIVKAAWTEYVPAAGVGVMTIVAIVMANSIHLRRQAAVMSLYTITEGAFREYQEQVTEEIGKNKEQKVRDAVVQKRINENPPSNEMILLDTEELCYDMHSGRYFKSSMEKIRAAQNIINEGMIKGDSFASLNDFYSLIGLPEVKMGTDLGWNTEAMLDLEFTSILVHEGKYEGKPCLAVDFRVSPMQDYSKFH